MYFVLGHSITDVGMPEILKVHVILHLNISYNTLKVIKKYNVIKIYKLNIFVHQSNLAALPRFKILI